MIMICPWQRVDYDYMQVAIFLFWLNRKFKRQCKIFFECLSLIIEFSLELWAKPLITCFHENTCEIFELKFFSKVETGS